MKNRGSLSRKIILLVGALLLAFGAVFCGLSISRSRVAIRKAIRQRMVDIANCAAGSVNGDTLASISTGDEGTPGYQAVYDSMAVFRDNAEVEYVYAIRDEGNGRFTFIVDTDPEDPGAFGSEVKYTEALAGMAAMLEKAAKEGDADRIRLDHDAVLDLYCLTADAAEKTSGAVMSAPVPEDGILEFPPAE